jgi:5-formyltetrahydrofolate cyclo-ligase
LLTKLAHRQTEITQKLVFASLHESLNLQMDKPALRQLYKQKRLQLTANEKAALEAKMLVHFQEYNWPPVSELFTFIPLEILNEPDTAPFCWHIQDITSIAPEKTCRLSAPVINARKQTMEAVVFDEESSFNENELGIAEPQTGTIISPEKIDMVLVPLLAFDRKGNRVGYGKGYYDHFMKQCRPGAVLAGLSFFGPEDTIEGIFEIDVPLTHCITPEQIYVF